MRSRVEATISDPETNRVDEIGPHVPIIGVTGGATEEATKARPQCESGFFVFFSRQRLTAHLVPRGPQGRGLYFRYVSGNSLNEVL